MDRILDILTKTVTSDYYKLLYVCLFAVIIFQPKIASRFATTEIYKILSLILNPEITNETAKEIMNDIVQQSQLEDMHVEYYNLRIKSQIYFFIGLFSFTQLGMSFLIKEIINVETNLTLLTMAISLIECNDNLKESKKIKKKIGSEINELFNEHWDLSEMLIEDMVKEDILKRTYLK